MPLSNLKMFAENIFNMHDVRMYRKRKDAFLKYCIHEFSALGYEKIEIKKQRNSLHVTSHNLIIGAPDADILITAHYDTPGRNGFIMILEPIFGTLISNIFISLFILVGPHAIRHFSGFDVQWLFNINNILIWLLILGFFIPNKHNRNDNTSGVLGVFRTAELIAQSPELKARCAFVLFDHEEIMPGLLGSKAFAQWRYANHRDKADGLVINLDCIGNGDTWTLMAKNKHPLYHEILTYLKNQKLKIKEYKSKVMTYSDHFSFTHGVSIMMMKKSLIGGHYIPRIHTRRDKICDLDQIEIISNTVLGYLQSTTKEPFLQ